MQDGDWQQQQRSDDDGGGDEKHERDDLHWSEERRSDSTTSSVRDERENLQVGEGGVTERNAARDEVAGPVSAGGKSTGWFWRVWA